MAPHGLQDGVRTDDIGANERFGVVQRVVNMRLGCEMHDYVRLGYQPVDKIAVTDIAVNEADLMGYWSKAFAIARVRQRVEYTHFEPGMVTQGVVDEVGADEAGPSGDEHLHGRHLTGRAHVFRTDPRC